MGARLIRIFWHAFCYSNAMENSLKYVPLLCNLIEASDPSESTDPRDSWNTAVAPKTITISREFYFKDASVAEGFIASVGKFIALPHLSMLVGCPNDRECVEVEIAMTTSAAPVAVAVDLMRQCDEQASRSLAV